MDLHDQLDKDDEIDEERIKLIYDDMVAKIDLGSLLESLARRFAEDEEYYNAIPHLVWTGSPGASRILSFSHRPVRLDESLVPLHLTPQHVRGERSR